MKQYRLSVVATLLYIVSPLTVQGNDDTDREAIETLIETVQSANNEGKVQGWVELFAEEFVYMPPGSPEVTTREALVEVAETGFRHDAAIQIEPIEIRVFQDWAFARTRVTGAIAVDGSGEVVHLDVKQLLIYKRTSSDSWKIARMISNANS